MVALYFAHEEPVLLYGFTVVGGGYSCLRRQEAIAFMISLYTNTFLVLITRATGSQPLKIDGSAAKKKELVGISLFWWIWWCGFRPFGPERILDKLESLIALNPDKLCVCRFT